MSNTPEDDNRLLSRLKAGFRHVPLLGPLVDCRQSDHTETIKQVFVTLLLATAPFWLGALIIVGRSDDQSLTLLQAFWTTVWDGGLFMCATSLLAPIFSIALEDPKGVRKFPSRYSHFVAVIIIICIASVFFGLGVSKDHLQQPFTFHVSVLMFWSAVCVLYLSTAYHTNRINAPRAFREQESKFTNDYRRHRR